MILLVALFGCSLSYGRLTPWRAHHDNVEYRLARIAELPSERGTEEALAAYVDGRHRESALRALAAAVPDHMGPLERDLLTLTPEQRQPLLDLLARVDDPRVNQLLASAASELDATRVLDAMAGRSDGIAVDTLAGLANDPNNDQETRLRAIRSLAPATSAKARTELIKLVQGEPNALGANALAVLQRPVDETEIVIGVQASHVDALRIEAVRFLLGARELTDEAEARLGEVLDVADANVQWMALKYLATSSRPTRAGPPAVRFLDDIDRRDEAYALATELEQRIVPAVHAVGPTLTTAEGKAAAARLLAELGGTEDLELATSLDASVSTELAPGVLFEEPIDYFRDGEKISLLRAEVVTSERERAAGSKDPAVRYVSLARAFLAGGRSASAREQLRAAALDVQEGKAIYLKMVLKTDGTIEDDELRTLVSGQIEQLTAARVRFDEPPSGVHRGRVYARLECYDHESANSANSEFVHVYDTHAPERNAEWVSLKTKMSGLPKTVETCQLVCGVKRYPCGMQVEGDSMCSEEVVTAANPDRVALQEKLDAIGEFPVRERQSRGDMTTTTLTTSRRCRGELDLTWSDFEASTQLEARSSRIETRIDKRAPQKDFGGKRIADYVSSDPPEVVDNRDADMAKQVAEALATALDGMKARVTRHFEGAMDKAKRAGDRPGMRTHLLWSQPELVTTETDALNGAFRETFLSDGEKAFR